MQDRFIIHGEMKVKLSHRECNYACCVCAQVQLQRITLTLTLAAQSMFSKYQYTTFCILHIDAPRV